MFSNQEKFSSDSKAFLESQFASFDALARKGLEGGEKLISLNIAAAKASAADFNDAARQLLTLKDPQSIFAFVVESTKPNADKAASYGRHLTEIASGIHADLTKAIETQIAGTTSKVNALAEQAAKSAPAVSENAVAMLKSVIGNANARHQQLTTTIRQDLAQVEAPAANAKEQASHDID